MTKEEILEGNRLIAEFLGYIYIPYTTGNSEKTHGWVLKNYKLIDRKTPKLFLGRTTKDLLYHKSWDWLMPVVEKIENLEFGKWYVHIQGNTVDIEDGNEGDGLWDFHINNDDPIMSLFPINKTLKPIETVWISCIEFIKWYNEKLSE